MVLEGKVKARVGDNNKSRKIKIGSFEECYEFLVKKGYEPFSSNADSITFKSALYDKSWGKITHVALEDGRRDLMYKKWELTLYNYNPAG